MLGWGVGVVVMGVLKGSEAEGRRGCEDEVWEMMLSEDEVEVEEWSSERGSVGSVLSGCSLGWGCVVVHGVVVHGVVVLYPISLN